MRLFFLIIFSFRVIQTAEKTVTSHLSKGGNPTGLSAVPGSPSGATIKSSSKGIKNKIAQTSMANVNWTERCLNAVTMTTNDIIIQCVNKSIENPPKQLNITVELERELTAFFGWRTWKEVPFGLHINNSLLMIFWLPPQITSINGDFYVVNTYLNYIMWNVTTIKGKAFVHGNRFLEGESLDILMDLTVHGGADIQPVPECIVDDDLNSDFHTCEGIYGDLIIENTTIKVNKDSPTRIRYITGCVFIKNSTIGDGFFDKLGDRSYPNLPPNECTKQSTVTSCMKQRSILSLKKYLKKFAYLPVKGKEQCTFNCYIDDLHPEIQQENCVTMRSLAIRPQFLEVVNTNLLLTVTKIDGYLEIAKVNATEIDFLRNVKYIIQPVYQPALEIKHNPNLKKIHFHKDLFIESEGVECSQNVVEFVNNPAYIYTHVERKFFLRLAKTEGCETKRAIVPDVLVTGLPTQAPTLAPDFGRELPWTSNIELVEDAYEEGLVFEVVCKKKTPENHRKTFWETNKPFLIIPAVIIALGLFILIPYLTIKIVRLIRATSLNHRTIGYILLKNDDLSFPADLSKKKVPLTVEQMQQVFMFIERLISTPVLRLREITVRGVEGGVATIGGRRQKMEMKPAGNEKYGDQCDILYRAELAKQIRNSTVIPVYDCPNPKDLKELHKKRNSTWVVDKIEIQRVNLYACHTVYEISNRPGAEPHKNENKFREVFDIWSHQKNEYYVIFGVGEELPAYCNRVFTLTKIDPPKKPKIPLPYQEMKDAGIKASYYLCEYNSEKAKYDRPRTFVIEFHNIPIEQEHPFSGRVSEMRHRPFIQLMFLAKEMDIPVFCNNPEVFFLLKLIHTAFFYIFNTNDVLPGKEGVHLAAIDIALDELDLFSLCPPDAVHVFALQIIDFCLIFIGDQQMKDPSLKPLLSYHSTPIKTLMTVLNGPTSKREPAGSSEQETTSSSWLTRQSLKAYEKSTLEVDRIVREQINQPEIFWKFHLPQEEKYKRYAETEKTLYMRRHFNDYCRDLQPDTQELKRKYEMRHAEYNRRLRKLKKMAMERVEAGKMSKEAVRKKDGFTSKDAEKISIMDEEVTQTHQELRSRVEQAAENSVKEKTLAKDGQRE